tara:strand:+ start:265 stop:492 length:228 start_codon:yes stop_codon:yes gene_type:complete
MNPRIIVTTPVIFLNNLFNNLVFEKKAKGNPINPLTTLIPIIEPKPNNKKNINDVSILSKYIAVNAITLPLPARP